MLTISSIAQDCVSHIRLATAGISGEQASYLVNVINRAIEEMRVSSPQTFKKTLGITWTGSRTGMVGVTAASQTISAGTLALPANGCSIRIEGDSTWNEMLKSLTLLFPYNSTSGSKSATAYGDSVVLESTVDRVLGCVLLHERRPLEVATSRDEWAMLQNRFWNWDYGRVADSPRERQPGVPLAMWVEPVEIANAIEYRARCTPLPNADFRATIEVATMPDEITVADIASTATTTRPVPGQRAYGILRALALFHWSGSPWFRNEAARPVINADYQRAVEQLGSIRPNVAETVRTEIRF